MHNFFQANIYNDLDAVQLECKRLALNISDLLLFSCHHIYMTILRHSPWTFGKLLFKQQDGVRRRNDTSL